MILSWSGWKGRHRVNPVVADTHGALRGEGAGLLQALAAAAKEQQTAQHTKTLADAKARARRTPRNRGGAPGGGGVHRPP
ncbi:hypothetical protein Sru01_69420 [Sphaerisporangium rufum]|uniref:Uncharacterized protein n=1 Tax=Sphaerisporangium rufum TaxID=1381558 RepID=A0A919V929_9ACTN|nr:hypothetical protein Sru01_69420 [Sphaerisporangium rufum]